MANEIQDAFNIVYADGPVSAPSMPEKPNIRSMVGGTIQKVVDNLSSLVTINRQVKDPVRIAITSNVTLTTLVNGAVVQGVTLATGDRIAPIGQTDATTNGIRIVPASGTPARATDADSGGELLGATFYVNEGTNANKTYTCSAPGPITVGTTPLPFPPTGDLSTLVSKTVTGGDLATGGGPISGNPVITVTKATTKTALDKSIDTQAMTPKTSEAKISSSFGEVFTDEDFAKALWTDANGAPILGLKHDGTVWARPGTLITDEYWEAAIIDANGVVLMGKPYDGAFMMGPFYDSTAKIDNAAAYIDSGNAVALTDKRIQLTFGEVSPVAAQIQGTNAVYKMVSGSTVTSASEDLLAINTLLSGTSKIVFEILYGQSLSTGGATGPAVTTTAFLPGRVVMPNGGIRALGTSQDGNYATTTLSRENIKQWVDAYERTDGNAGETPASGMAIRLAGSFPSNEAILLAAHGVGGQAYANIKKNTVPFNNMLLSIRRAWIMCQALGLQMEVKVHFVHGEADRTASAGTYKGYLVELQSDITTAVQGIVPGHGQVPLFVSQLANFTAPSYGNSFSWVPADQAAAAAENPTKIFLSGPRYPFATVSDGIHLQAVESYKLGDMEAGAEIRAKASQPSCLRVTSAVRSGATITLTCSVPTAPIVRDTTLVTDPGADSGAIAGLKYGFRYVQTGGTARTISDVTASGSTITVTLSGDPGSPSAENLYIALDGVANNPGGPTTGPRACFRDSTSGTNAFGNRYNWLAAGNIPVTT